MKDPIQVAVTVGDEEAPKLGKALERAGLSVVPMKGHHETLELLRAMGLRCLIVLSRMLPSHLALQFLTRLHSDYPDCATRFPVVVATDENGNTHLPKDAPCVVGTIPDHDGEHSESLVKRLLHRVVAAGA